MINAQLGAQTPEALCISLNYDGKDIGKTIMVTKENFPKFKLLCKKYGHSCKYIQIFMWPGDSVTK